MNCGWEEEETGRGKLELLVFFGLLLRMDWKFLLKTSAGNLIHRPYKNTVNTHEWKIKALAHNKKKPNNPSDLLDDF